MANTSMNQYINRTLLENDPFEAMSENDVDTLSNSTSFQTFVDVHSGITKFFVVLSDLLAIAACVFLVVSILRFKRLRSSRINVQILNISALYIIHITAAFFTFYLNWGTAVFAQFYVTVLILYMLFAFLLGLDWLVIQKKPHWNETFGKYQNVVTGVIYLISSLEWVVTFWYERTHHTARVFLLFCSYVIILLASITLNIVKKCLQVECRSSKTSYAFVCSNIIIYSLVPMILLHLIFHALESAYLAVFISFIPEIFFILHPVIMASYLVKRNKHFRMAYLEMLKLMRLKYHGEELEESDSEDAKANGSRANYSANVEQLDPKACTHEVNLN